MSTTSSILISVAQVAAGGTIVQGLVQLMRRRGELRKLDKVTDSVAVDTADRVVVMLREELDDTKRDIKTQRQEHAAVIEQMSQRIAQLNERVAGLAADLAAARAEIRENRTP